jgi:DNA-binding MarR family transcriptional regulator
MEETMDPMVMEVAGALRVSVGLLVRRLRQAQAEGELRMPEISALARLDHGGSMSAAELARLEQISPQSMGATVAALEARGLIERRPDPADGRRSLLTVTEAGLRALGNRRNARTEVLARALSAGFSDTEVEQLRSAAPLIERLARSL